jgi:hypothetical protein
MNFLLTVSGTCLPIELSVKDIRGKRFATFAGWDLRQPDDEQRETVSSEGQSRKERFVWE